MRMYPRQFPAARRRMPQRRAEKRVYEALAGSDREGFVYYEWRRNYGCIELDFALWAAAWGRIALQVKGGHYRLTDGEWCLRTRNGFQLVDNSPLDEAWLAALDLHDAIKELAQTTYRPFVIPALVFPDMAEPDSAIEKLARRKNVYVIWGVENLVANLGEIVRGRGVLGRLSADRICHEVLAVTDGLIRLDHSELNEERLGTDQAADTETVRGLLLPRQQPVRMRLSVGGLEIARVTIGEVRSVPGNGAARVFPRPHDVRRNA